MELRTKHHPNLDELLQKIGPKAAGELLGMSTNALAPSSLTNGVRHCVEIAAATLLGRWQEKPSTFICQVSPASAEAFRLLASSLKGVKIAELTIDGTGD